jgi:AbrB family looped-hinge helix DNA binding protein
MGITITLGKAGRLVVPKAIRERLGLAEGSRLRLEVSAGQFAAVPIADAVEIRNKDGFPVILGGTKRERGGIVKALQADREAPAQRMAARRRK